jgi:uncharacterized lipoprotein YajG
MKLSKQCNSFMAMLFLLVGILMFGACDSGEKVIDKATGNQDV